MEYSVIAPLGDFGNCDKGNSMLEVKFLLEL